MLQLCVHIYQITIVLQKRPFICALGNCICAMRKFYLCTGGKCVYFKFGFREKYLICARENSICALKNFICALRYCVCALRRENPALEEFHALK